MKNKFLILSFVFLAATFVFWASPGIADAAIPQVFITWKSKSFAPSFFQGKILPGSNVPILASVEVIDNGKVANLSALKIYWYVDEELFDRGVGLQSVAFRTQKTLGGEITRLRVEIPTYPSGPIIKDIMIPLVSPVTVLESPYPGDKFSSASIVLQAIPYFFGVSGVSYLSFDWQLNGNDVKSAENPQQLTININKGASPGSVLDVSAKITNPNGYFESNTAVKSLIFSP